MITHSCLRLSIVHTGHPRRRSNWCAGSLCCSSNLADVHVASIIHVTDTHLFVDSDGATRQNKERARLVRSLDRVGVSDLDFAEASMVERFTTALEGAVDLERSELAEGAPVIGVHSGDAEAFGDISGARPYRGFALLAELFERVGLAESTVAIYGNHDVWPGSVALLGLNGPHQDAQKMVIDEHVEIVGLLPPVEPRRFAVAGGPDLVFVPLNTVNSRAVRGGIFAYGRMSMHPPMPGGPLETVSGYGLNPGDLNIAVMHHPVHFYRPVTLRDRLGIGQLDDAATIASSLSASGIDLVLAGHRHRLDPAFGASVDARAPEQDPLPSGVAQLVAISPTIPTDKPAARQDPVGTPPSGVCVYRVIVDGPPDQGSPEEGSVEDGRAVRIERLIHSTEPGAIELPTYEPAVVLGLRIDTAAHAKGTL